MRQSRTLRAAGSWRRWSCSSARCAGRRTQGAWAQRLVVKGCELLRDEHQIEADDLEISNCGITHEFAKRLLLESCTKLDLSHNKLEFLGFLKNTTKLQHVDVSNNLLSLSASLSALKHNEGLKSLSCFDNPCQTDRNFNDLQTSLVDRSYKPAQFKKDERVRKLLRQQKYQ